MRAWLLTRGVTRKRLEREAGVEEVKLLLDMQAHKAIGFEADAFDKVRLLHQLDELKQLTALSGGAKNAGKLQSVWELAPQWRRYLDPDYVAPEVKPQRGVGKEATVAASDAGVSPHALFKFDAFMAAAKPSEE